eukprot:7923918-Ditylum_brightwellii.AAC.1
MVQKTLSNGLFDWSAKSLAALGYLSLVAFSDIDTAHYFGERALQMQERCGSEVGKARMLNSLYVFVFHHLKPLQNFSKPLVESHHIGMRNGDKASAMWSVCNTTILLYIIGKPLKVIEEQCKLSVSQMDELNEEEQASCLRMYWQLCFNLMGLSTNTVEFSGEAMNENKVFSTLVS